MNRSVLLVGLIPLVFVAPSCKGRDQVDIVHMQDIMWSCDTIRNGKLIKTRTMFGANGRFVATTVNENSSKLTWILGGYEISGGNELAEFNVGVLDSSGQGMIASTFRPGINFQGVIKEASASHLEFDGTYTQTHDSSVCSPLKANK